MPAAADSKDPTNDYLEISPWVERPLDLREPLRTDITVDVAIIGGGYTGLTTALALKQAGVDVVILERDFAGGGASGRNAGHLTPTIGKDLPTLLMLFGKTRAARLVKFADEAVHVVEELIRQHRIDCDYQPSGNIMAAVHPKQEARLRKAAQVAAQLGAHVRFLSHEEMRACGVPPAFLSGALEESGGTLHPGKYVMGLRRTVLDAGIKLHEQTAVDEIIEGPKPRVRTGGGVVTADRLVLATNAYTVGLGRFRHTIYPLYDTLFETEPLSVAQRDVLGWRGREGIYTAHESLESYHLTSRGTILGGSKGVRYHYGSALLGGRNQSTLGILKQAFRDRFPQLSDVKMAHFWGGWIDMTMHFLPTLGCTGRHRNIYYALGYNGHGVAAASAIGPLLADCILKRKSEHVDLFTKFVPPLPPEPFRWLLIKGALSTLNYLDGRIDRQIRTQRM
ncbi:MAG: NAD(P)/FAD-dependent oxidoreductase [Candidatus Binatia bacterium]